VRLSAGEVKRIGLARAFLRDAPLWILDDTCAIRLRRSPPSAR